MVDIQNTDIPSIARAYLKMLQSEIAMAIPITSDRVSKFHLQDLASRIKDAFEAK